MNKQLIINQSQAKAQSQGASMLLEVLDDEYIQSFEYLNDKFKEIIISKLPNKIGDKVEFIFGIPSLNGEYAVNIDGNVYSNKSGSWKKLNPTSDKDGRKRVTPSINGKTLTRTVCKLMVEVFYNDRPKGFVIRHLDGNPSNNQAYNLDVGTQSENMMDRTIHGYCTKETHHNAKLTEQDIAGIRESNLSQRKLARKYGVTQPNIQMIKSGKAWRDDIPKQTSPMTPRDYVKDDTRFHREIVSIEVKRVQDINWKEITLIMKAVCTCEDNEENRCNFGHDMHFRYWLKEQNINYSMNEFVVLYGLKEED